MVRDEVPYVVFFNDCENYFASFDQFLKPLLRLPVFFHAS